MTCSLLWLARALHFIVKMLDPLAEDPSKKLSECVLAGYEVSLKPHHGFMTKGIFKAAMSAAPARPDFMAKLADDEVEIKTQLDSVTPDIAKLLDDLNALLKGVSAKSLTAYA